MVCLLEAFPRGEAVNLSCSIAWFWVKDNISLLVRNSYLSILPDDNATVFTASVL